jgi:hypothetical protein
VAAARGGGNSTAGSTAVGSVAGSAGSAAAAAAWRWAFPEFELVIETEPDVERALASADLTHEERLLQRYRDETAAAAAAEKAKPGGGGSGGSSAGGSATAATGGADVSDDDDIGDGADIEATQDEAFHEFQRRTSVEPQQCVRYCRHHGSEASAGAGVGASSSASPSPLWISSESRPSAVPPCAACGGPRAFEFQVMPQLLTHLGVDTLDGSSIDWGTLVVYTCANSCTPPGLNPHPRAACANNCTLPTSAAAAARPAGAPADGADATVGGAVGSVYLDEFVWRQMPNEAHGAHLAGP